MHPPRLPHWLVYASIVIALLFAALGRQQHADAPPPPPPLSAKENAVLADATPFDPALVVRVRPMLSMAAGAAFSVADNGVWITAKRVVQGCGQAAIMVSASEGVPAKVTVDPAGEAAVLTSAAGAPALPLAVGQPINRGDLAFELGFPQGRPGEIATRYLGPDTLTQRDRSQRTLHVLDWAEIGRTEGLKGSLMGLSGAPVLDGEGRVEGVVLDEAPRHGRIYTTSIDAVTSALKVAGAKPTPQAEGVDITTDNYGLTADELRRALRVAPVVCISR